MAKRMQLVLNQDVSKLGHSGDLVEVAPGYARNYLIPRGMAFRVTPGVLKQLEIRKAAEVQRLAELKNEAEKQKTALDTIGVLRVQQLAGEEDVLFGRVTAADVAELILKSSGHEVDRRNINVPEIRKLGIYTIEVKLHPEVTALVKLEVIPE